MKESIRKRSVVLNGHATSLSLEDAFWAAVHDIAAERGLSVRRLLETIDATRGEENFSSAVRVHVLEHFRMRRPAEATCGRA